MSTIEPTTIEPTEPSIIESPPVAAKPWWKRKRFAIPAAVLVLAIIGSAMGGNKPTATPTHAGNAPSAAVKSSPPVVNEPPPVVYDTPKIADFAVNVKVTSKQCFGSAGCNVEVKTTLIKGLVTLDPAITYDLTYELTGDESGPIVDTMEMTGDQYTGGGTKLISTPSSGTTIRARITSIEQS